MLYTDRIKNLNAVYPRLSRVWIKTGDSRTPLKSVWMNDEKLNRLGSEASVGETETELADDHLVLAA